MSTVIAAPAATLPGRPPSMPDGLSLRDWQTGCTQTFTDWATDIHTAGTDAPVEPAFLVNAPPGAGKTRSALACASTLFAAGMIDRIVIVSPGRQTATQWAQNLADPARIDLGNGKAIPASQTATSIRNGRRIPRAVSVTYAGLANAAPLLAAGLNPDSTLVVLDEVHHMTDDPDSTWGQDCLEAFGPVRYKMVLSGTPVRTDRKAIPFLDYYAQDGKMVADAHVEYTMHEALDDQVLRPLVCEGLSAQVDTGDGTASLDELTGPAEARGYSSTVRSTRWLRPALVQASKRLEGIRTTVHPNVAALVVCADTDHAEQVHQLIVDMQLGEAVVVDSTRPGARAALANFDKGRARWLVAVQMVSEGVDIPRLAVCLYATTQRTELVFRQIAGRIMRTDGPADRSTAVLIHPRCKGLDAHVRRFAATQQATARAATPTQPTATRQVGDRTLQPASEAWASGEVTAIHHGLTAVAPVMENGPSWSERFEEQLEAHRLKDPSAGPEEVLRTEASKLFKRYAEHLSEHHPDTLSPDEVIYRTVNRWGRELMGQPQDADLEQLMVRTAFIHMASERAEAGYPLVDHGEHGWWPVRDGKMGSCLEAMGADRLPDWMTG